MASQAPLLTPDSGPADVLILAGEHSGDQHAARVVRELQQKQPDVSVAALGGPQLKKAGAQLLFDLPAHSVVGLVEVLKHYGFFKQLFDETLAWIERNRPKVVVLVDYPGFNLRLAKQLKERGLSRQGGGEIAVYFYISPQIWAWKAHRRFTMAEQLDELGVIFPFEIETYADTRLPVKFVGHPFVEPDYVWPVRYEAGAPVLLLPGSRRQPVQRIFPMLAATAEAAVRQDPSRRFTVIYAEDSLKALMQEMLARHPGLEGKLDFVESGEPVAGSAVLTSSGTMSLACALAGLPGAILYRAHPLTYWIGRRVVKIPYLGMMNLILKREMYPEFIQEQARVSRLVRELEALQSPERVQQTQRDAEELRATLTQERGDSAADRICALMSSTQR
ncbi:MAG: lipid-A-disaccharide synthase [Puniceicoccaceae bacterium 5H]|nr:MAG: lipid-A-disaccharide synthase [Puniceicoccaceae bacterium 5H]